MIELATVCSNAQVGRVARGASRSKRRRNLCNGFRRARQDDLRLEPQDPQAELGEPRIPAAVRTAPTAMLHAIHFNHEPGRRSKEVYDEAGDDDLAPKRRTKLIGPERLPQEALRLGRRPAHGVSACLEDLLTTELAESGHGASSRPAWGRAQRPQAQAL
jgi:hypothetical protein